MRPISVPYEDFRIEEKSENVKKGLLMVVSSVPGIFLVVEIQ